QLDARRLRVVDRLFGLRHDTVGGGDDDHRNIGDLGAAGAHLGKRLVAGRVDEGDRLAVVLDAPGAGDLRDAARPRVHDIRLANVIEQRRFAVIDMTHDRDDRSPRLEVLLGVAFGVGFEEALLSIWSAANFQLHVRLQSDRLRQFGFDDRVDRRVLGRTEFHQLEEEFAHLPADRFGECANGNRFLDRNLAGARLRAGAFGAGVDFAAADAFVGVVHFDLATGDGDGHGGLALLGALLAAGVPFAAAGNSTGVAA